MQSNKIRIFTKFTVGVIRLQESLPKYYFKGYTRLYSKSYTYYGGFDISHFSKDKKKQMPGKPKILDNDNNAIEKLASVKNQLTNCRDPMKKYDYLMELRNEDINLYYRYMRENTSEVLCIFCTVDGIVRNISQMGFSIPNTIKLGPKRRPVPQLDISATMDFLRKLIDDQRQAKTNANSTQTQNMNKSNPISAVGSIAKFETETEPVKWFKKGFMLTPKQAYMIYIKCEQDK